MVVCLGELNPELHKESGATRPAFQFFRTERQDLDVLTAIKLLHTVIWAFVAGTILVLPVTGVLRRFRWALILTVIVLLEFGVLVLNGGRCPLSDWAARFTADHAPNFDIFLPVWLAEHNKLIFSVLFVAGELLVIGCWLKERFAARKKSIGYAKAS